MNTKPCTCATCGGPADVTLNANGNETLVCIGCIETFAPMFDYKIIAVRVLREMTTGRVFNTGCEIPEECLPDCHHVATDDALLARVS